MFILYFPFIYNIYRRYGFVNHYFNFILVRLDARTVLFLGYSDNALGGNFETSMGRDLVDVTRINRTFFLKIGYAWQI